MCALNRTINRKHHSVMDFYPAETFDLMNLAQEDETSLHKVDVTMNENEVEESSSSDEELSITDDDDDDGLNRSEFIESFIPFLYTGLLFLYFARR